MCSPSKPCFAIDEIQICFSLDMALNAKLVRLIDWEKLPN